VQEPWIVSMQATPVSAADGANAGFPQSRPGGQKFSSTIRAFSSAAAARCSDDEKNP
jgi:hypothetical protein